MIISNLESGRFTSPVCIAVRRSARSDHAHTSSATYKVQLSPWVRGPSEGITRSRRFPSGPSKRSSRWRSVTIPSSASWAKNPSIRSKHTRACCTDAAPTTIDAPLTVSK